MSRKRSANLDQKTLSENERIRKLPTFTPFIERIKQIILIHMRFLDDVINKRINLDLSMFKVNTPEQLISRILYSASHYENILENWVHWVIMSAPIYVMPGEYCDGVLLLNGSKWDVPRSELLSNSPGAVWRDILELRGVPVTGDEHLYNMLYDIYVIVARTYVYMHGFVSLDEFGVVFGDDWRTKMGVVKNTKDGVRVVVLV